MPAILAAENPTFHALTGTQKVGATQIAAQADYAGTITSVKRMNTAYWCVTTRTAVGAFRSPALGASASIWIDQAGRYVVDYYHGSFSVEVDRTRTLKAAIGVAASSTAQRWATGPYAR